MTEKTSFIQHFFGRFGFSTKRSTRYWKVCNKMDPSNCSNKAFTANIKDHGSRNYEEQIMSLPKLFYDRKGKKHKDWKNALYYSCRTSM